MAFYNEEKRKRIQHEIWVISTFLIPFFSFTIFIIIIIIIKISFLYTFLRERRENSAWHKNGMLKVVRMMMAMGKNVHTINLNLIQIAFCHHYKAKASLLLLPHT